VKYANPLIKMQGEGSRPAPMALQSFGLHRAKSRRGAPPKAAGEAAAQPITGGGPESLRLV
jgi:hypothetical protein